MTDLQKHINSFLDECMYIKGLNGKTIKAYSIDLRQFSEFCTSTICSKKEIIECYIKQLYSQYKPKTAKRKIACLKAFFTI